MCWLQSLVPLGPTVKWNFAPNSLTLLSPKLYPKMQSRLRVGKYQSEFHSGHFEQPEVGKAAGSSCETWGGGSES